MIRTIAMTVLVFATLEAGARQDLKTRSATVTGRVISSDNGTPVARAIVSIFPESLPLRPPVTTSSDDQGHFRFADVQAGFYRLIASANGFSPTEYGQRVSQVATGYSSRRIIELQHGERLVTEDLKLFRLGAISGSLVDQTGEPISGLSVRALRPMYEWRGNELRITGPGPAVLARSTTDDRGRFRLTALPAGSYYLQARAELDSNTAPGGFAQTYFPGSLDSTAATPVALEPGTTVDVSFTPLTVLTAHVTGMLHGSDGGSLDGGTVVLLDDATSPVGRVSARTSASRTGEFKFWNVPAGKYSLRAFGPVDHEGYPRMGGFATVEVGEVAVKPVSIMLHPLRSIRGRIHFEDGPSSGILPSEVVIQAHPASYGELPVPGGGRATVAKDWTFAIARLSGRVGLTGHISSSAEWIIKRIEIGGKDVNGAALSAQDSDLIDVKVVFSNRPSQLVGTVKAEDGSPSLNYTALVFPQDRSMWTTWSPRIRHIGPDQRGGFRMAGLPPGAYNVIAVHFLPGDQWEPGILLQRLEPYATKVFLNAGSTSTVSLAISSQRPETLRHQ